MARVEMIVHNCSVKDFASLQKALEKSIQEAIDRQAEKLLQVAKDTIPKRTGDLKPKPKCFVFR